MLQDETLVLANSFELSLAAHGRNSQFFKVLIFMNAMSIVLLIILVLFHYKSSQDINDYTFCNYDIKIYNFLSVTPKRDKINAVTWTYYVCFFYKQRTLSHSTHTHIKSYSKRD